MNKKPFVRFLALALTLLFLTSQTSCSQQKGATGAEAEKAEKNVALAQRSPGDPPPAPKTILPAQCAGQWYPGSKGELKKAVDGYLSAAKKVELPGRLVALISPHAGYPYSGPTAGHAYRQLEGRQYDTVVVVGFAHGFGFEGASVYAGDAVETPLGYVEVDMDIARALIRQHEKIIDLPEAFYKAEHSLENQFPFLQKALEKFKIVPVMIGYQESGIVDVLADALAEVLKGKNALLVASSDMSHFLTYDEAVKLDGETTGLIEKYDTGGLSGNRLCGHGAVEAVMRAAKKLGADKAVKIHYENSGDVTGDRSRVVGYLAAALLDVSDEDNEESAKEESPMKGSLQSDDILNEEQQKTLLKIARESLEAYIRDGERKKSSTEDPALKRKLGMFVTLNKQGRLRGCMGHFAEDTPLVDLTASQVIVSATGDPRFPKVSPNELKDIDIEISVLSSPRPVDSHEDIVVGRHGVILRKGYSSATFLPQVAPGQGWDRDEMLTHLAMKAGLRPDGWKSGASFDVYTAQVFGEEER
ncbi:MAG: AmmeMemoRadiSam system protein B [bacterium]